MFYTTQSLPAACVGRRLIRSLSYCVVQGSITFSLAKEILFLSKGCLGGYKVVVENEKDLTKF